MMSRPRVRMPIGLRGGHPPRRVLTITHFRERPLSNRLGHCHQASTSFRQRPGACHHVHAKPVALIGDPAQGSTAGRALMHGFFLQVEFRSYSRAMPLRNFGGQGQGRLVQACGVPTTGVCRMPRPRLRRIGAPRCCMGLGARKAPANCLRDCGLGNISPISGSWIESLFRLGHNMRRQRAFLAISMKWFMPSPRSKRDARAPEAIDVRVQP